MQPYVICHKRLSIVSVHLKHIPKQNISRSKKIIEIVQVIHEKKAKVAYTIKKVV